MNKRTVICCCLLVALCNVTVLAAPTECGTDNNSIDGDRSRFWPDFSVIGRYINPFDWIGKPTLPKPKRYDWAFEKDSKNTPLYIYAPFTNLLIVQHPTGGGSAFTMKAKWIKLTEGNMH